MLYPLDGLESAFDFPVHEEGKSGMRNNSECSSRTPRVRYRASQEPSTRTACGVVPTGSPCFRSRRENQQLWYGGHATFPHTHFGLHD